MGESDVTLNSGVFDGPGLPLLIELEQCGFDLDVRRGELWVRPVEQLTAEQRASIQHHRDELVTLVRICDDGVQKRLLTFKQQLSQVPEGTTPDFVFQRGTPYAKSVCFSCGAVLPEPHYGRCWRCSLAWRMAVGVPIPADRAAAYDGARVVA